MVGGLQPIQVLDVGGARNEGHITPGKLKMSKSRAKSAEILMERGEYFKESYT